MLEHGFVRRNGVFGGVCGGLAYALDLPVFLLRFALIASFFLTFGATFLIYMSAVFSFPSELTIAFDKGPKFLGVCFRLSKKMGISEHWLRFFTLLAFIFTGFLPVFAVYMILYLLIAEAQPVGYDVRSARQNSSGMRDVN